MSEVHAISMYTLSTKGKNSLTTKNKRVYKGDGVFREACSYQSSVLTEGCTHLPIPYMGKFSLLLHF